MRAKFKFLAAFIFICSSAWAISPPGHIGVFFDYLKKTASETLLFNKETTDAWYEKLNNLQIRQNLENSLEKMKELFDNSELERSKHQKKQNRQFLESIGDLKISNDGQTLNDYARNTILRLRPDLCETDYYQNPARAISYFLMLDPRGFVENIRIIRGPLGAPMTIKEAYQYYTRTNPEKATKILNMLESLQKLGCPDADQDQLQTVIESVKQTIELLNNPVEPDTTNGQ